jgi:hypothetical protein
MFAINIHIYDNTSIDDDLVVDPTKYNFVIVINTYCFEPVHIDVSQLEKKVKYKE